MLSWGLQSEQLSRTEQAGDAGEGRQAAGLSSPPCLCVFQTLVIPEGPRRAEAGQRLHICTVSLAQKEMAHLHGVER